MTETKRKPSSWENDFVEFLSTEEATPPRHLRETISGRAGTFLYPSPWHVFSKLAATVFGVSIINLAICPQFGLGWFRNPGLVRFFMSLGWGHLGCNIVCGTFFITTAIIVAVLVMRPEELRLLRKTKFLQVAAISALTLSAFIALGAEVFLPFALAWLFGAILGGLASVEAGYWLRVGLWQQET
jgi:hypothetical protein